MNFNFFGFKTNKSIDSILKQNDRSRSFLNFESMNNILIFFSFEDLEDIKLIADDLRKRHKKVFLWAAESKKQPRQDLILPENVKIISKKEESNISGVMDELNNVPYDTLIDFTTSDNTTLMCLLAGNKAKFCIGIRDIDYKLYDLTFSKNEEIGLVDTYKQLLAYLNLFSN